MTSEEVLKEIEQDPEGFMIIGPQKGQVLASLIEKHKPKSVLEIGTNLGYSSILMAMHLPEEGKITTLELSQKTADRAQEFIKKAGFEDKINIIVGDARETITGLADTYDFVFIDAAKKQYLNYLQLAEDNLSPNSVIVADNVGIFAESVRHYLIYVKERYQSKTVQVGQDALEVSLKLS